MKLRMKVKFALEESSGVGVGHELSRAVRSCECYDMLTHNGHVYVYDNTLRK